MTEREWRESTDPELMLAFLRTARGAARRKGGRRRLRLFACACLRGIWPLLRKAPSRAAVEAAERHADGLIDDLELSTAHYAARTAHIRESWLTGKSRRYWQSWEAAVHASAERFSLKAHPAVSYATVARASASAAAAWALDRAPPPRHLYVGPKTEAETRVREAVHADWLRDVFGNPFRPVRLDPSRRTEAAVALARTMYDERRFDDMPVLGDALEEAGCADGAILGHCRDPKVTHVRGCWVVDLVLGKS